MKKLLLAIYFSLALTVLAAPHSVFSATPAHTVANTKTETAAVAAAEEEPKETTEATAEDHEKDTGIVGLFGLDGRLFLAQLINFAIVLFVLWKWVFTPVTKGMQERAAKIEASLVNSDKIAKEKEEFEHWKNQEMSKARSEAGQIISEAKNSAEKTKQTILDQAKQEQDALVEKTKQQLETEKQKIVSEAKAEIATMVVSSTEKILKNKLDSKTDSKLIQESLKGIE